MDYTVDDTLDHAVDYAVTDMLDYTVDGAVDETVLSMPYCP